MFRNVLGSSYLWSKLENVFKFLTQHQVLYFTESLIFSEKLLPTSAFEKNVTKSPELRFMCLNKEIAVKYW